MTFDTSISPVVLTWFIFKMDLLYWSLLMSLITLQKFTGFGYTYTCYSAYRTLPPKPVPFKTPKHFFFGEISISPRFIPDSQIVQKYLCYLFIYLISSPWLLLLLQRYELFSPTLINIDDGCEWSSGKLEEIKYSVVLS